MTTYVSPSLPVSRGIFDETKMKAFAFLTLLLIGGAAFYFLGGAEKYGLVETKDLPETMEQTERTFVGAEQGNPFAE